MMDRDKKLLSWEKRVSKIAKKVLTYFMDEPSLLSMRGQGQYFLGKNRNPKFSTPFFIPLDVNNLPFQKVR